MNQLTDSQSLGPPDRPSGEPACEADLALWAERQSHLLRQKQFDKLDLGNLIEELDDMAGSQRRELRSRLIVIILHLLKCQYQPERKSTSWIATLGEHRSQIAIVLEDSPSLTGHLKQYADKACSSAVSRASTETGLAKATFPIAKPYSEQGWEDICDTVPHEWWFVDPECTIPVSFDRAALKAKLLDCQSNDFWTKK